MRFIENEVYHIYNRGNNHQPIFFNPSNYQHFLNKVKKDWQPNCEILAWCLMPNPRLTGRAGLSFSNSGYR